MLAEQPLMRNVLADLALESEAATALALRVARAVDASARDASERALARIVTAVGKYWVCKRCPPFVNEAQECLGGNGYVEESVLPRLYRQAPLNSIWEGSGNIQCLDVLRALRKEPASAEAFFAELEAVRGGNAVLDREIAALRKSLEGHDGGHGRAFARDRRADGDGAPGVMPRARRQRRDRGRVLREPARARARTGVRHARSWTRRWMR